MHATRKGFTLIELMISLVLLTIVGGGVLTLLNNQQRATRQQAQLAMLQSNVRTGTLLLPSELRELHIDATGGDLLDIGADNITYRAMRGTSVACAVSATAITLRNGLTFGYRAPVPGRDNLLLFVDNDTESATDDSWQISTLAAPAAATCPDGAAATSYTVAIHPDTVAMVALDAVVRTYEVMELRLYQAGGRNWLGARSVSAGELTVQPVLGPLTATGVQFIARTAAGAATTDESQVRTIDIRIVGETDGLVSNGSSTQLMKQDSLTARIRLRNAPRL